MVDPINWSEQNKIRVRESDFSEVKHLVAKALIMLHIKIKHRNESNWIKIYSEWPVVQGKVCDVYYENVRSKVAVAYEVQKITSRKWLKETAKAYDGWEVYGMKSCDYIVIDLKTLPDNIYLMSEKIKELII